MKPITEDTVVGFMVKGEPIKAERLSKWAYNQIAATLELLEACEDAKVTLNSLKNSGVNSYSLESSLKFLERVIAKAEGRAGK